MRTRVRARMRVRITINMGVRVEVRMGVMRIATRVRHMRLEVSGPEYAVRQDFVPM